MKKIISSIICIALCLGLFTGCSSGSDSAKSADMYNGSYTMTASSTAGAPVGMYDGGYGYVEEADAYYGSEYEYPAAEATGEEILEQNVNLQGRKLIKTVDMSLETLTYEDTVRKLENEVNRLGGYIQSSYENNNNAHYYYIDSTSYKLNNRTSSYTVRIPSEKLNAFINTVGGLGTILYQSLSTQDVTLEYVDTESRAEALQIQLDRLLAILEKAETVEDIITLESRISEVTYQLERKESVLKNYDNLVEFSTVSLSVQEVERYTVPEKEPETVGERIAQGLTETFYDIGEGFKNFIVGFLVDLPYIVIWCAIIAACVFVIVKIVRKHNRRKSPKASAKAAATAATMEITEITEETGSADPKQGI